MSLDVIKTQMRHFLASKEEEVLAIRGDWGVGKTFTWDQTLREAQALKQSGEDPNAIGLNYYAYVSLFGVSSLQDLRTEIAFNKLNTIDLKHAEGVRKFQQASGKFLPKIVTQALKYAGVSAGTLVDTMFASMSNSMIRNTIVCIDDFERCDIPEKETLGFINDLKCKRGCKVVLLLNEKQTKDFKSYREKVIDYDLEFKLHPSETRQLLKYEVDDGLIDLVFDHCQKLKVTNLRIIIKTLKLLEQARTSHNLESYGLDLQIQFVNTLTLANYCFYGHDTNTPDIGFLLDLEARSSTKVLRLLQDQYKDDKVTPDQKEINEKYKVWDDLLIRYGYQSTDNFDEAIIMSVISGYIDKDEFKIVAKAKDEIYKFESSSNDINDAINAFYTLLMNEENLEFRSKELINCLIENIENVRPKKLNDAYKILKRIGKKEEAKEIINRYIAVNIGQHHYFSFEDSARRLSWDDDLKPLMEKEYKSAIKVRPAIDTFKAIISQDNPIPSELDIESLEDLTSNDIEELIRNHEVGKLKKTIKLLLELNAHDMRLSHIYTNTISVLQKIACESEQKRMLVEHYGIPMDNRLDE
ncbi:hypothetical protein [Marinobacter shengliensis]|uniref:hypothetical protein n=1 Tax=Marinobacter shengliensis TaxID=1389223 RepID=UPI0011B2615D|nr:hypothetical protein [Marinobacter shengliensis]